MVRNWVDDDNRGHDGGHELPLTCIPAATSAPLVYQVTGVPSGDLRLMQMNIRQGLRCEVIVLLADAYQLSQREIAMALSISSSTLHRRKQAGRLSLAESDRAVRLAHLKDLALALMRGNDAAAINWLHSPVELFGGESPLQHADTFVGARDVEDLIGRIRHGVFS